MPVTQDSNNQVPGIAQKAARNRRRQGAANIRKGLTGVKGPHIVAKGHV